MFQIGESVVVSSWVLRVVPPLRSMGVVVEGPHRKILGIPEPSYTVQMTLKQDDSIVELFLAESEMRKSWLDAEVWDEIQTRATCEDLG